MQDASRIKSLRGVDARRARIGLGDLESHVVIQFVSSSVIEIATLRSSAHDVSSMPTASSSPRELDSTRDLSTPRARM